MKKMLMSLAVLLAGGVVAFQTVSAQDDSAQRRQFALQHCYYTSAWVDYGYTSRQACYDDYYASYPRDPNGVD